MDSPTSGSSSTPSKPSGLHFILRALRHRNYRLFFIGQSISLVGTWLTRVATSWLVYRLTPDHTAGEAAFLLGLVSFSGLIPLFVFAPLTGVLVDRWDRHRILILTAILSLLQSLALAILALGHWINIPQVIVLSIFQGLVNSFDVPARQAFLVEMVEDTEDLSNAIALNSSMFNGARLVGPAVAGLLIAGVGEGLCFLIDAISYIGVVAALLMMHVKPRIMSTVRKRVMQELKEGFQYAFGFKPIRALLLLVGAISFLSMSYQVLMPIFADRLSPTGHGARMLGWLNSAVGVGSLLGALYLASRRSVVGLGKVLALAAMLFGAALIAFGLSPHALLALGTMFVAGFGMIVHLAAANTVLQTVVEDDKRGRVMSFYSMSVIGMAPFGSLLCGMLASRMGEANTIILAGTLCIIAAGLFSLALPRMRELVHSIYRRKGILPEIAKGLQSASVLAPESKG
ncbi:MAG: MFS transporter [Phycisphaerales bacterium]|nr:MFS transporter [Phycisphaerales bacterium]